MFRNIFDRLLEAYLNLQLSKGAFFQKETKFLGNVVSENGVAKLILTRSLPSEIGRN